MKKSQNQEQNSFIKNEKNNSFTRILKRFYNAKGTFSFDIFQYLKASPEKLQIIYANIRV